MAAVQEAHLNLLVMTTQVDELRERMAQLLQVLNRVIVAEDNAIRQSSAPEGDG
jgi:hypothetical protein